MPPPQAAIDAAVACLKRRDTHSYQMTVGRPELRRAFADWYSQRYGVEWLDPDKNILPLIGSKEGVLNISMAFINPGDGAFYGPKLDFHLADSLGRTWQCGTIQLDSQLPERFELEYTGEDGQKHRPVMIHRVVLGSIERFIGVITEHFAGAFPTWLAPVQVKVLTVTDRADEYAAQVAKQLDEAGFRVETDTRNEKVGKKIREATLERCPICWCWETGTWRTRLSPCAPAPGRTWGR